MTAFWRRVLILVFCLFFAFLNWYCNRPDKTGNKADPSSRTAYAGITDGATYVGMEKCTGCHANIHATFIHTGMGKSFDVASQEKSSADFNNHPLVTDRFKNLSYHPYWNGNELHFLEYRMEGRDTVYQRDQQVNYIVGSGQHTNSHMWVSNGYFYQAPMTFYTQKKQWDLPPGFENGDNSRFSRIIGLECMTCHNGYPDFVTGSENKYTKVKNGIDCERCHGPGSIHVDEKQQGLLIDTAKYIDYSIVNPSKLPIDLQFDVCQRCHIQGNAVLNEGKSFLDFKPGMHLSEVMNVFMPVYANAQNSHIMASHAERLKMSKCFLETDKMIRNLPAEKAGLKPYKNGLTCITCHNPHISVKTAGANHFNQICQNCHGEKKNECTLDPSKRTAIGNNCVSCHMPSNSATDIPHVSVHDHRIGIHKQGASKQELQTFIGINCINNPNPPREAIAQAFINYVEKFGMDKTLLDSALKYMDVSDQQGQLRNLHRLVQIEYLKKNYPAIARLAELPGASDQIKKSSNDNRDAWTSYRIGEAFKAMNENTKAIYWFEKANQLAPYNAEFANKYGTALGTAGKVNEAYRVFSALVLEHPEFAPGYCNLGYVFLSRDRNTIKARQLFDQALQLDPDYELALLNKATSFIVEGKIPEARQLLQKVLKINPDNEQAKLGLQQIKIN